MAASLPVEYPNGQALIIAGAQGQYNIELTKKTPHNYDSTNKQKIFEQGKYIHDFFYVCEHLLDLKNSKC